MNKVPKTQHVEGKQHKHLKATANTLSRRMRSRSSLTSRKQSSARNTSSMYSLTSPSSVFSMRPLTRRASSGSVS